MRPATLAGTQVGDRSGLAIEGHGQLALRGGLDRAAGGQQRPTDDVEGHGRRFPEDETSGDDRGTRNPDDTEGHGWRFSQDTEATDDRGSRHPDDTEGHGWRL